VNTEYLYNIHTADTYYIVCLYNIRRKYNRIPTAVNAIINKSIHPKYVICPQRVEIYYTISLLFTIYRILKYTKLLYYTVTCKTK